jgi:hypothetical protein
MKLPNQFARNNAAPQRAEGVFRVPKLTVMALVRNMENAF